MDGTLVIEEGTLRDLLTLYALNRSNLRGQPLQRGLRAAYKTSRGLLSAQPAARRARMSPITTICRTSSTGCFSTRT